MATSKEDKMIDITSQVVGAAVSDEKILRLFYQDFAQPGVKQVGKALSTVLGLGNTILLPVKMVNEKAHALYASHMEQYRKNLEQVPEEKVVEVAPEIGVPILEKLEKTTNKTISDMYINLLTNASHIDLVNQAHPRFVSVIESLTQDEALILNDVPLRGSDQILHISIESHLTFMHEGQMQHGVSKSVNQATKYHKPGIINLPERAAFYFDNLRGLGLLTDHKSNHFKSLGDPYAVLKESYKSEMVPGTMYNERKQVIEGYYERTPFCRLFLEACKFSAGSTPPQV